MSIHNKLAPCLLHLNRWFPKDIVNKILRMAGPCAVQMCLLAHNKARENYEVKESTSRRMIHMFIKHGEVRLFRWLCDARGIRLTACDILPVAAAAGNVESIKAFCQILPRSPLTTNVAKMAKSAARHDRVNVLEFLMEEGFEEKIRSLNKEIFTEACTGKSVAVAQWVNENMPFENFWNSGILLHAVQSARYAILDIAISMTPEADREEALEWLTPAIAETEDWDYLDGILMTFPSLVDDILEDSVRWGHLRTLEWGISRGLRYSRQYPVELDWIYAWEIKMSNLGRCVRLAKECGIEVEFDQGLVSLIEERKEKRRKQSRKRRRK